MCFDFIIEYDFFLMILYIIGPIIYTNNKTGRDIHRVIGVVSFGFECALPKYHGFYAPVYPQLNWIKNVIAKTNTCPNVEKKNVFKAVFKDVLSRCSSSCLKTKYLVYYLLFSYTMTNPFGKELL